MKVFVLAFFILCLEFLIIESVNLKCQFRTDNWWVLGDVYECYARNQGDIITDNSNRHIDTINGNSSANPNVKAVSIYDSNCFYFPLGLQELFTKMEGIAIINSNLREIRREDFKEFKSLRRLNFHDNQIQFLEQNLFEFVLKLEGILLHNNKIAHIDANVFNNFLDKLSHLYLSGNICRFEDAYNDKSKVNQIISKIQTGVCKDEEKLPTTTTTSTTTTSAPLSVISAQFDALTKLIEALRDDIKCQKDEIAALKDQLKAQEINLEASLNSVLGNITAQFEKCDTCAVDVLAKRVKNLENVLSINSIYDDLP